jgi:hypothetical protein
MIANTVKVTSACLNAMDCVAWCICWFGLLVSTFKSTQRPSMWPGSPKEPKSTSEEPECSRARRVTQSGPCGLEPHQDYVALDRVFSAAITLVNYHVRLIYSLMEMHVFMILVVKAHAKVSSWAGMCGDRLTTVVFRRGATEAEAVQDGHR